MEDFNNTTNPDDSATSQANEQTNAYSTTYVQAQQLVNGTSGDMNVPSLDIPSITNAAAAALHDANSSASAGDAASESAQATAGTPFASQYDATPASPADPPAAPAATSAHPIPSAQDEADVADYAKPSKPTFPINQLPDLRETLDPDTPMDPQEAKSREEFTTVYDIIDSLEESLDNAKTSLFAPGMVRVDREEFAGQLDELKKMLPVQLERASALMREAERRLESAQTQANAIVASAQSRAADTLQEANKQAQIIVGQDNITDLARQRARTILDNAQARADHLTHGADAYCTTVMTGLQEQLGKLSHDVQAGLNVLEERQRAAGEAMPSLDDDDYADAR